MEDQKLIEVITSTQKITRMILKAIMAIAVVAASTWVYLAAFGVVEEPNAKVQEIAAHKDSVLIIETTIDSLTVDTNAVN